MLSKIIVPIRVLLVGFIIISFYAVWNVPTTSIPSELRSYENLPDYPFVESAEHLWKNGNRNDAMALLEYAVENKLDDAAMCEDRYNEYLSEMKKDDSALGRILSLGKGAVTGEVDDFSSLAGSAVGDFFIYGDIRDIARYCLGFEDEFVLALSSLGLVTQIPAVIWADPIVSMVKALKKMGALTEPLVKQIYHASKRIAKLGKKAGLSVFKQTFGPLYDLSRNCKSWGQFESAIRQAKSVANIQALAKIVHKAGNSKKLHHILSILHQQGELAGKTLGSIYKKGQSHLERVYKACQKGPKGVRLVLNHPTLVFRTSKNIIKGKNLLSFKINETWDHLKNKHGNIALYGRYILLALLAFLSIILFPINFFLKKLNIISKSKNTPIRFSWRFTTYVLLGCFALATLVFFAKLLIGVAPSSSALHSAAGSRITAGQPGVLTGTTLLFFLIALFAQFMLFCYVHRKISEIENKPNITDDNRLKALKALDIHFDLPLYAGMFFTIFSFIILTFDPSASRILAYSSTVLGILVSVLIRLFKVYPLERKWMCILADSKESK